MMAMDYIVVRRSLATTGFAGAALAVLEKADIRIGGMTVRFAASAART